MRPLCGYKLLLSTLLLITSIPVTAQTRDTTRITAPHLDLISPLKDLYPDGPIIERDTLTPDNFGADFWKNFVNSRTTTVGKLFYGLTITPGYRTSDQAVRNAAVMYEPYKGKRISKIVVRVLPPYGISVYDTVVPDMPKLNWLQRAADATHMKSSAKMLERQMTTKVGSIVDPFVIVQEEISLKNLKNVSDALIILTDDPLDPDAAIMNVICKDRFSWDGIIESDLRNTFGFRVGNSNLFGLGQSLEYRFKYDRRRWKRFGNTISFDYPNIAGTHIDADFNYKNDYEDKIVSGMLEYPFMTAKTRWAGGIGAGRYFYSHEQPDRNVKWFPDSLKFNYNTEDLWLGHSFPLRTNSSFNKTIYLTGRSYTVIFKHRPDSIPEDITHFYRNRVNTMISLQYTSLKYYTALQIFDLGRLEFVPNGFNVGMTGGIECDKGRPSGYLEAWGVVSIFNSKTERYYSVALSSGGYFNTKDRVNRAFIKVEGHHITPPISLGSRYILRLYNDVSFIRGFKRLPQEYLLLDKDEIRGFSSDSLHGDKKLAISVAGTIFTPRLKYDNRLAFGAFVDMGVLAPESKTIFRSKSYFGFGLQISLQNNFFFVKNITVRLACYPRVPADVTKVGGLISNWSDNDFHDYGVYKPQFTPFE